MERLAAVSPRRSAFFCPCPPPFRRYCGPVSGDSSVTGSPPRTLLGRVRAAVRARHYSPRTEQAYVAWVRRFVIFHGRRHPADLGGSEVQAFFTYLAERRRVSGATQNQAAAALLVLYRCVLGRPLPTAPRGVVPSKEAHRPPLGLTPGE